MADSGVQIDIQGIPEVVAYLDKLPVLVVKVTFRESLKAACEVLMAAIRPRIPEPPLKPRKGSSPLSTALQYRTQVDPEGRGGSASIGFGKQGPLANWLETGHRMVGHRPKLKMLGFVRPFPFLRPAFQASYQEAIDAFRRKFLEIAKAGIAGIKSEGDLP